MAQGVAWMARRLGVPATIVVPDNASPGKLAAVERLGGRIVRVPWDEWWAAVEQGGAHPVSGPERAPAFEAIRSRRLGVAHPHPEPPRPADHERVGAPVPIERSALLDDAVGLHPVRHDRRVREGAEDRGRRCIDLTSSTLPSHDARLLRTASGPCRR